MIDHLLFLYKWVNDDDTTFDHLWSLSLPFYSHSRKATCIMVAQSDSSRPTARAPPISFPFGKTVNWLLLIYNKTNQLHLGDWIYPYSPSFFNWAVPFHRFFPCCLDHNTWHAPHVALQMWSLSICLVVVLSTSQAKRLEKKKLYKPNHFESVPFLSFEKKRQFIFYFFGWRVIFNKMIRVEKNQNFSIK